MSSSWRSMVSVASRCVASLVALHGRIIGEAHRTGRCFTLQSTLPSHGMQPFECVARVGRTWSVKLSGDGIGGRVA